MDRNIQVEKKNRVPGCVIALLILLILIAGGILYVLKSGMVSQGPSPDMLGSLMGSSTTTVAHGNLTAAIDEASGTVRSNRSITLKWKTTGTVSAIHAAIGDRVKKDEVLAELSPDTLPVSVLSASVELAQAQEDYAKLENTAERIAKALSELVTAQKAVDDAKQAVADLDPNLASSDAVRIAYENFQKAQAQFDASKDKFEEVRSADPDNDARKKRIGDVVGYRNARDNALAEYRRYLNGGDALEREIREAALQLAEATLIEKQQAYEDAKAGPTQAELAAAQAKISAAQTTIDYAKLIAPFDGVITKLDAKVNETITSDQVDVTTAAQIDDLSQLFVDIAVSELEISQVKVGQEATVQFISIPGRVYHGVVSSVADTGKTDTSNNSVSFTVTIRLTDADAAVVPGLTADIQIPIASATDVNYLPIQAVYMEDGQAYVNRIEADGSTTKIPVELGVMSGLHVEVKSDELSEGQEVETFDKSGSDDMNSMPQIMFF